MRRVLLAGLLALAAALAPPGPPAMAADTDALVRESPLEASVREIAEDLRCPVCQGENLYDSRSSLAAEMRAIIREQLAEDRSRAEIIAFFVERYGDYVRLAPHTGGGQLVVWLLPALALLVGALGVTLAIRRRARMPDGEMDPDPR